MITKETGKIMLWDQRSRSCKTCEYHLANQTTIPDHLCSKKWYGSSKAMESDMAVSMAHTLKNDGCEIKVIHADNDSVTTSKLKVDFEDLEKRDEKNHLKKGLSKSLHQMSINCHLFLDDTREYILRCFMYAITGGTTEDDIKVSLDRIVPHIYLAIMTVAERSHGVNMRRIQQILSGNPLTNESLKEELLVLVSKYTSQSKAIAELGSTQANESFNQMASSKAPKSRHYGGSCSLKNRLSAAVLKKNQTKATATCLR
ncbi:Hypothetical predicted protein [Mytilus galloprovincialis]|uniref:Mutator-like transposase domain-containing protein n=1 Tax=Mytilus galloprovincialis TaxID=29158 RepID=A0A8B6E610_MYTGA|nr:Hypothetical predicted protein [Mytilus galloprovincialis]